MRNDRVLKLASICAVLCLLEAMGGGAAHAQYRCAQGAGADPRTNPCPAPDDLILPLPGGLSIAFREVVVPGAEFWGNPQRNVELGNPDAPIFEGPRLVSIAGSFKSSDGKNWVIILGKYEVTVAQFAAIIGDGDLVAGLGQLQTLAPGNPDLAEIANPQTDETRRSQLLSRPVTGLSAEDYAAAIQKYSTWCHADAACLSKMPQFGSMPGFFRLPTEVEWEYAARGGSDRFESLLPFPKEEAENYAAISTAARDRHEPTAIGRFEAVNGIYDLFGNVGELAEDRFYAELGQGKPGMYVVRGGDFKSSPDTLRASSRAEVPGYRRDEGGAIVPLRSNSFGIRLAIGSITVSDTDMYKTIDEEYRTYRSAARFASSAGVSTQASLLQAARPLDRIDEIIRELRSKLPAAETALQEMDARAKEARQVLLKTTEDLAHQIARNAIRAAGEAGRSLYRARKAQEQYEIMMRKPNPSEFDIAQRDRLSDRAAYEKEAASIASDIYISDVRTLASYRDFARQSLDRVGAQSLNARDKAALELTRRHLEAMLAGGGDPAQWKEQLGEAFSDPALFEEGR